MDNNYNYTQETVKPTPPAHHFALAGLICGIIAVAVGALQFFSIAAIPGGLVLAIVGVCMCGAAKKRGNVSAVRTWGLVLSVIGIVFHALPLVACIGGCGLISCFACLGMQAASMM